MSEPNPALKENERTQWGWQSKNWQAMGFPSITTSKQNKYWIPGGGSKWIYDLKLRRTDLSVQAISEPMRSDLACGFEARFKYCPMHTLRAMHSLIEKRERTTYIMQGLEDMNLSVSAFNHHGRQLCCYLNLSFTAHSNYWDRGYHHRDLSLHESNYQVWS